MGKGVRLKVYAAQFGFHDSVVAAHSQAVALVAWGTRQNLFAEGRAKVTHDPDALAAALAHPEVPLRRAVGSKEASGRPQPSRWTSDRTCPWPACVPPTSDRPKARPFRSRGRPRSARGPSAPERLPQCQRSSPARVSRGARSGPATISSCRRAVRPHPSPRRRTRAGSLSARLPAPTQLLPKRNLYPRLEDRASSGLARAKAAEPSASPRVS